MQSSVTALLQEPPLPVVGIEEPELTVHPGAVPLLVDYLKQAAKRSQVIVTTHSPELLDLIDTDDVRVVTREDGVSAVNPLDPKQLEAVRSGLLSLGKTQRGEGLRPQLALTRMIDLPTLRQADVPCFGTLERALVFLGDHWAGRGVYPPLVL